jgi:hypothetical protein
LVQHSLEEAILALRMQRADEAERIGAGVLKANCKFRDMPPLIPG